MKQQIPDNQFDMQNQLMVRDSRGHHLPSTEVREFVPEFRDEIDLRDLIDTLIRRKTVVLVCLVLMHLLVTSCCAVFGLGSISASLHARLDGRGYCHHCHSDSGGTKTVPPVEFGNCLRVSMLVAERCPFRVGLREPLRITPLRIPGGAKI